MKKLCLLLICTLFLSGCAYNPVPEAPQPLEEPQVYQDPQLSKKIEDLQAELGQKEAELSALQQSAEKKEASLSEYQSQLAENVLPPNAKPGECYARVFVEPIYTQKTERILKKDAYEIVKVIPAEYGYKNKQVLVKEASTKLLSLPAEYAWKEEQVLVREASTEWNKGRGRVERLDAQNSEILCLQQIPAEYKTIRKQIMVTPPRTKEVVIPAEYKTIKVKVVTKPAQTVTQKIPAEYEFVTRTVKKTEGRLEWRQVLCKSNTTCDTIKNIQRTLKFLGYDPGCIDGIFGSRTKKAMIKYQKDNNIASGALTYETLQHLDIL